MLQNDNSYQIASQPNMLFNQQPPKSIQSLDDIIQLQKQIRQQFDSSDFNNKIESKLQNVDKQIEMKNQKILNNEKAIDQVKGKQQSKQQDKTQSLIQKSQLHAQIEKQKDNNRPHTLELKQTQNVSPQEKLDSIYTQFDIFTKDYIEQMNETYCGMMSEYENAQNQNQKQALAEKLKNMDKLMRTLTDYKKNNKNDQLQNTSRIKQQESQYRIKENQDFKQNQQIILNNDTNQTQQKQNILKKTIQKSKQPKQSTEQLQINVKQKIKEIMTKKLNVQEDSNIDDEALDLLYDRTVNQQNYHQKNQNQFLKNIQFEIKKSQQEIDYLRNNKHERELELVSEFETTSDSDEGHLFTCAKRENLFGRGGEHAFFTGKNLKAITAPAEILNQIQPNNQLYDYKCPTITPNIQIGDTKPLLPNSFKNHFILPLFKNNKYCTVFETNVIYSIVCFLVRKYPELVFKASQKSDFVKSIFYYLPKDATTQQIVKLTKIQRAQSNNVSNKQLPGHALLGVVTQMGRLERCENAGVVAVPFLNNQPVGVPAAKVATMRSGLRRVSFDCSQLCFIVENEIDILRKMFCTIRMIE